MPRRSDSTPTTRTIVQHVSYGHPVAVYVIPADIPGHDLIVAGRVKELKLAGRQGVRTITQTY